MDERTRGNLGSCPWRTVRLFRCKRKPSMRTIRRWVTGAGVAAISLGIVWAARGERENARTGDDLARAREMVELIQRGQLNLKDATAIAEKRVGGTSLKVTCGIESSDKTDAMAVKRLLYEVTCFAEDKIEIVRVDGLTRDVVDVK